MPSLDDICENCNCDECDKAKLGDSKVCCNPCMYPAIHCNATCENAKKLRKPSPKRTLSPPKLPPKQPVANCVLCPKCLANGTPMCTHCFEVCKATNASVDSSTDILPQCIHNLNRSNSKCSDKSGINGACRCDIVNDRSESEKPVVTKQTTLTPTSTPKPSILIKASKVCDPCKCPTKLICREECRRNITDIKLKKSSKAMCTCCEGRSNSECLMRKRRLLDSEVRTSKMANKVVYSGRCLDKDPRADCNVTDEGTCDSEPSGGNDDAFCKCPNNEGVRCEDVEYLSVVETELKDFGTDNKKVGPSECSICCQQLLSASLSDPSQPKKICSNCKCTPNNCNPDCLQNQKNKQNICELCKCEVCNNNDCEKHKQDMKQQVCDPCGRYQAFHKKKQKVCEVCACPDGQCNPLCLQNKKDNPITVVCDICECEEGVCFPSCIEAKQHPKIRNQKHKQKICEPCKCEVCKNYDCEKHKQDMMKQEVCDPCGRYQAFHKKKQKVCEVCACPDGQCNALCLQNKKDNPITVVCDICECEEGVCFPSCIAAKQRRPKVRHSRAAVKLSAEDRPYKTFDTLCACFFCDKVCEKCTCKQGACNPECLKHKTNQLDNTLCACFICDKVCEKCACKPGACNPECLKQKTDQIDTLCACHGGDRAHDEANKDDANKYDANKDDAIKDDAIKADGIKDDANEDEAIIDNASKNDIGEVPSVWQHDNHGERVLQVHDMCTCGANFPQPHKTKCGCKNTANEIGHKTIIEDEETSISQLHLALDLVRNKCKEKDCMIDTLKDKLNMHTCSRIFDRMLKTVAKKKGPVLDYDRVNLAEYFKTNRNIYEALTNSKGPCTCYKSKKCEGCKIDPAPLAVTDIKKVGTASLLVRWMTSINASIIGYEVCVDEEPKARVLNYRHSVTVVTNVDCRKKTRVCVYALSTGGRCYPGSLATFKPK